MAGRHAQGHNALTFGMATVAIMGRSLKDATDMATTAICNGGVRAGQRVTCGRMVKAFSLIFTAGIACVCLRCKSMHRKD
jgi:hypothetical protein